jgi:hypothetical protein
MRPQIHTTHKRTACRYLSSCARSERKLNSSCMVPTSARIEHFDHLCDAVTPLLTRTTNKEWHQKVKRVSASTGRPHLECSTYVVKSTREYGMPVEGWNALRRLLAKSMAFSLSFSEPRMNWQAWRGARWTRMWVGNVEIAATGASSASTTFLPVRA